MMVARMAKAFLVQNMAEKLGFPYMAESQLAKSLLAESQLTEF